MPFKSKAQMKYLYAKHPEVAEEFSEHTPKKAIGKLPEHVTKREPMHDISDREIKRKNRVK